jgi:hypothetical protein
VRRLINTNRRVAMLWHRAHGPQQLRRLLHDAAAANAIGSSVSAAQCDYADRWRRLLERYGSERLRAALLCHGERVTALLASARAGDVADPRFDRRVEAEVLRPSIDDAHYLNVANALAHAGPMR